jgi:hypothetical protein
MFRSLAKAILDMEISKREVELRIKARGESARQWVPTQETLDDLLAPYRMRVSRYLTHGRRMYTSGTRFWKK